MLSCDNDILGCKATKRIVVLVAEVVVIVIVQVELAVAVEFLVRLHSLAVLV